MKMRLPLDDSHTLTTYTKGLLPCIQAEVIKTQPRSFAEVVRAARVAELSASIARSSSSPHADDKLDLILSRLSQPMISQKMRPDCRDSGPNEMSHFMDSFFARLDSYLDDKAASRPFSNREHPRPRNQYTRTLTGEPICFRCSRVGHFWRSCPENADYRPSVPPWQGHYAPQGVGPRAAYRPHGPQQYQPREPNPNYGYGGQRAYSGNNRQGMGPYESYQDQGPRDYPPRDPNPRYGSGGQRQTPPTQNHEHTQPVRSVRHPSI